MMAAAQLDPARGRVVGFAWRGRDRPELIELEVDGKPALRLLAADPAASLLAVPALLADLPAEACCFSLAFPGKLAARLAPPVGIGLRLAGAERPFFEHHFATAREIERYTEGSAMETRLTAEITGLANGRLGGRLRGPGGVAGLSLVCAGEAIAQVELDPPAEDGADRGFRADLPARILTDGVHVLEIVETGSAAVLARYPIAAGAALAGDILGELAMLRAEVDELRRGVFAAAAEPALAASERPLLMAELIGHVEAVLAVQDARVEGEIARLREILAAAAADPAR